MGPTRANKPSSTTCCCLVTNRPILSFTLNSGLPSERSLEGRVVCASSGQTQLEEASHSVFTSYPRSFANSAHIVDTTDRLLWTDISGLICQSPLWKQCV